MSGTRYQIAVDGQPRSNRHDGVDRDRGRRISQIQTSACGGHVRDLATGDTITIKTPGRTS
jgi:hypothetical protein